MRIRILDQLSFAQIVNEPPDRKRAFDVGFSDDFERVRAGLESFLSPYGKPYRSVADEEADFGIHDKQSGRNLLDLLVFRSRMLAKCDLIETIREYLEKQSERWVVWLRNEYSDVEDSDDPPFFEILVSTRDLFVLEDFAEDAERCFGLRESDGD